METADRNMTRKNRATQAIGYVRNSACDDDEEEDIGDATSPFSSSCTFCSITDMCVGSTIVWLVFLPSDDVSEGTVVADADV